MLKITLPTPTMFGITIASLTDKVAEKLGLVRSSQIDYRQLSADLFDKDNAARSTGTETDPIPPYDDPLY
jgi:hypothetical protein